MLKFSCWVFITQFSLVIKYLRGSLTYFAKKLCNFYSTSSTFVSFSPFDVLNDLLNHERSIHSLGLKNKIPFTFKTLAINLVCIFHQNWSSLTPSSNEICRFNLQFEHLICLCIVVSNKARRMHTTQAK